MWLWHFWTMWLWISHIPLINADWQSLMTYRPERIRITIRHPLLAIRSKYVPSYTFETALKRMASENPFQSSSYQMKLHSYCTVHPIKTYNTHKLVESSCTCTLSKSSTTQSKFDYQMCSIQLNWNLVGIWWIAFYLLGFFIKNFFFDLFRSNCNTPQLLSRTLCGMANGIFTKFYVVFLFSSFTHSPFWMLNLIEWLRMLMSAELQVSNHYFIRLDSKWIFIRLTHRSIK